MDTMEWRFWFISQQDGKLGMVTWFSYLYGRHQNLFTLNETTNSL